MLDFEVGQRSKARQQPSWSRNCKYHVLAALTFRHSHHLAGLLSAVQLIPLSTSICLSDPPSLGMTPCQVAPSATPVLAYASSSGSIRYGRSCRASPPSMTSSRHLLPHISAHTQTTMQFVHQGAPRAILSDYASSFITRRCHCG